MSNDIYDSKVICPKCGFDHVHPIKVRCQTGQDGEGPYHSLSVQQMTDENGKSNLAVINESFGSHSNINRVRELDTKIEFQCEGCHVTFQTTYAFHKGQCFVWTELCQNQKPYPQDGL